MAAAFKISRARLLRIKVGDKILVRPAWSYEGWVEVVRVEQLGKQLWFDVAAPATQNISAVPEGEVLGHQAAALNNEGSNEK